MECLSISHAANNGLITRNWGIQILSMIPSWMKLSKPYTWSVISLPELLSFLFQEKCQIPRSAAFPRPGNLLWISLLGNPRIVAVLLDLCYALMVVSHCKKIEEF